MKREILRVAAMAAGVLILMIAAWLFLPLPTCTSDSTRPKFTNAMKLAGCN